MCHPPHPSLRVTLLLIFYLENRISEHLRHCLTTSETEINSDVLIKNLVKCYCCCKDTVFCTAVLLVLTVNNWGLHNNPSAWEYCQMFLFPLLLFYFFVLELNVSRVMTGLGSVKGKRQLCAFQLARWFISLLPVLGLSCIKPMSDQFSFNQKGVDKGTESWKRKSKMHLHPSTHTFHTKFSTAQHNSRDPRHMLNYRIK